MLDDAVERGRMTRDDADRAVRRARRGAARATIDGRRARASPGSGPAFPISDYEDLTAAQVTERLDGLSADQLRQVRDHERRNANRKTVLAAVERKLP